MILQHYIKIAFRNLTKYKVQSAISIVGLAILMADCTLYFVRLRNAKYNLPSVLSAWQSG